MQTRCWPVGAGLEESDSRNGTGAVSRKSTMACVLRCFAKCVLYPDDILQFPWSLNKLQSVFMNGVEVDIQHYNSLLFWGERTPEMPTNILHTRKSGGPDPKKVSQTWIGECVLAKFITSSHTVWTKNLETNTTGVGETVIDAGSSLPHLQRMALLPLFHIVYRFLWWQEGKSYEELPRYCHAKRAELIETYAENSSSWDWLLLSCFLSRYLQALQGHLPPPFCKQVFHVYEIAASLN